MIVTYLGASLKEYCKNFLSILSQKDFVCPKCGGSTHLHGFYKRKLKIADNKFTISIARVKCVSCNSTHAVLPDFVAPRKHYPVAEIEDVIKDKENGIPTERIDSSVSVSTIKRWISQFNDKAPNIVGALQSILYTLYGVITSAINIQDLSWFRRIKTISLKFPNIESSDMVFSKVNIWLLTYFPDIYI